VKVHLKNRAVKKPLTVSDVEAGEVFRFLGNPGVLWLRTDLAVSETGCIVALYDGTASRGAPLSFHLLSEIEFVQGAFVEDGADE
jgi:hypothetical protein